MGPPHAICRACPRDKEPPDQSIEGCAASSLEETNKSTRKLVNTTIIDRSIPQDKYHKSTRKGARGGDVDHCSNSFLFFTHQPDSLLFRRKRNRKEKMNKFRRRKRDEGWKMQEYIFDARLFLISILFIITMLPHELSAYGAQEDSQQQQQQSAFYNEPMPLVYMGSQESGSGDGRLAINQFSLSSSSSISPSLITAKCWNNYENDNDCKHINVITASNANDIQPPDQASSSSSSSSAAIDDDSLITPVVIFESSSSIESTPDSANQSPPAFMAPPYFSQTARPDAGNAPLARHRTPPTANDVYAAPPAGATQLPPTQWNRPEAKINRWPAPQSSTTDWPDQAESQPATRPTNRVFVATPAPKKPAKTTTLGRKCRDENDDDCDEPEEVDDDENNNIGGGGGGSAGNAQNAVSESDKEDDDGDDGGAGDDEMTESGAKDLYGGPQTEGAGAESGSGNGPDDDNEPTEDDDGGDGSGSSEPPSGEQTTQHLEVEPEYRPQPGLAPTGASPVIRPDGHDEPSSSSSTTTRSPANGAEIEIVVHSTLPPIFTTTNQQTSSDRSGDQDNNEPVVPTPSDNYHIQATSTTIMPDDTITSRPVFPSTSPASSEGAGGDASNGADELGVTGEPGGQQLSNATSSTEQDDLWTFKPVPMPPIESDIRPNDLRNLTDNNSSNSYILNKDGDNNDGNKLDDKHKFDPNAIPSIAPQPPLPPPQKFDSPWREKSPSRSTGGQSSEPWPSSGSRYARPRTGQQEQQQIRDSIVGSSSMAGTTAKVEVLPTLLVYASIVIIVVTATIFSLVAFAFWRRNTARQRALLLQKALNGGPSQHQIVGSMSQASQMVANIQQPGLLSTYGPGKGMGMGKVTTSIIKSSDESPIAEEDEEGLVDNSPKDSLAEGSLNGVPNLGNGGNMNQRQANSSWSTSDDQTTTATTTTTTSGSHKTNGSQQVIRGPPPIATMQQQQQQQQLHHQMVPNGVKTDYSYSLSDERQNSSSMSDSQGSPVENGLPPLQPMWQRQQQHHQPQHQYPPPANQAMGYPPPQPQPYHHPPPLNAYYNNGGGGGGGVDSRGYGPPHGPQPPPHQVTGYYNPQAVIQDRAVGRYNNMDYSNQFDAHV